VAADEAWLLLLLLLGVGVGHCGVMDLFCGGGGDAVVVVCSRVVPCVERRVVEVWFVVDMSCSYPC